MFAMLIFLIGYQSNSSSCSAPQASVGNGQVFNKKMTEGTDQKPGCYCC